MNPIAIVLVLGGLFLFAILVGKMMKHRGAEVPEPEEVPVRYKTLLRVGDHLEVVEEGVLPHVEQHWHKRHSH